VVAVEEFLQVHNYSRSLIGSFARYFSTGQRVQAAYFDSMHSWDAVNCFAHSTAAVAQSSTIWMLRRLKSESTGSQSKQACAGTIMREVAQSIDQSSTD